MFYRDACARSPVTRATFGVRGPRQTAMGDQLNVFSRMEKQENEYSYADTCFAGALRPRSSLFAWRIRESCTRHVVTKPFAAQTWRVVEVNRAHGVDLGEWPVHSGCLFVRIFREQWPRENSRVSGARVAAVCDRRFGDIESAWWFKRPREWICDRVIDLQPFSLFD
jgi:hypothetical protein